MLETFIEMLKENTLYFIYCKQSYYTTGRVALCFGHCITPRVAFILAILHDCMPFILSSTNSHITPRGVLDRSLHHGLLSAWQPGPWPALEIAKRWLCLPLPLGGEFVSKSNTFDMCI